MIGTIDGGLILHNLSRNLMFPWCVDDDAGRNLDAG